MEQYLGFEALLQAIGRHEVFEHLQGFIESSVTYTEEWKRKEQERIEREKQERLDKERAEAEAFRKKREEEERKPQMEESKRQATLDDF